MLINSNKIDIWNKYCGFLDMSLTEYMSIQLTLLFKQIEVLSNCELGKRFINNHKISTIDDFKKYIPLTSYIDYADMLNDKREDVLPEKPAFWIETTWEGGIHPSKYAPYSQIMMDINTRYCVGALLMSTAKEKYDFSVKKKDKLFFGMATLPYFTGLTPYGLQREITLEYLPDIEQAEQLGFRERTLKGFSLGLQKGIDHAIGLSSVLVKIGESFSKAGDKKKDNKDNKDNKKKIEIDFKKCSWTMGTRLFKAFLLKKLFKRKMLPKDIWQMKGILCGGTDSFAFKDRVEGLWGIRPLEIYAGTEISIVGIESWKRNGMTLIPDLNFYEFIKEDDSTRSMLDPAFLPPTLLINQVEEGQHYEIVITNLQKGIFIRYRVGDMVKCISNEEGQLPQFIYVDRIAHVIDIAGFTRLTQRTFQAAFDKSGLPRCNWVAYKEYDSSYMPYVCVLLEFETENNLDQTTVKESLRKRLNEVDSDFKSIHDLLEADPLKLNLLKIGAFDNLNKKGMTYHAINPGSRIINELNNFKKDNENRKL
ncbi:MAG: auxin-responsive promoter [Clostridia bacterium]|nr:auxin-responsive promoter [Clostridia bacterium]